MKKIFISTCLLVVLLGIGCYYFLFPRYTKLAEVSLYKSKDLELNLVVSDISLPFHFQGKTFAVACKTTQTADSNGSKYDNIKAGWMRVPDAYLGDTLQDLKKGSRDGYSSLLDKAKKAYVVTDTQSLAVIDTTQIYFTFDGCESFVSWTIKDNIANEWIVETTPEFEICEQQRQKDIQAGLGRNYDCWYKKFEGENRPQIQIISAQDSGRASFKVRSKAITSDHEATVSTKDYGKSWEVVFDSAYTDTQQDNDFKFSSSEYWPLQWQINFDEEKFNNNSLKNYRVIKELISQKEGVLDGMGNTILVTDPEIKTATSKKIGFIFRLANQALLNPNGPRDYSYMSISSGFSRLEPPPTGSSFPVYFLGDKFVGITPQKRGKFENNKLLLATLTFKVGSTDLLYKISLERY